MNVGLFWFFTSAWAEKAGYVSNSHSNDEIDLPFEFAGTMVGFWMVRALTKPFGKSSERFRSTLLVDFLSSGVMGLLYTLVAGVWTENVASAVAHSLYPAVPGSLDAHEYTPLQQHMRPFELLLLAGAMWWTLNRYFKREEVTSLAVSDGELEAESKWDVPIVLAKALGVAVVYLLTISVLLSALEPEGLGWTLATTVGGMGLGTLAFFVSRRAWRKGLTTVLGGKNDHGG